LDEVVGDDYLVLLMGSMHVSTAQDDIFTSGLLMGLLVSAVLIAILMIGVGWMTALQVSVPTLPKQKKA
jgi:hypothetical protein